MKMNTKENLQNLTDPKLLSSNIGFFCCFLKNTDNKDQNVSSIHMWTVTLNHTC